MRERGGEKSTAENEETFQEAEKIRPLFLYIE